MLFGRSDFEIAAYAAPENVIECGCRASLFLLLVLEHAYETITLFYAVMCLMLTVDAWGAPIILPGAPGQGAKELTAEEAIEIADTSYTQDDARFMRDMIPHHQQAVVMAELVEERTNNEEVKEIAGRILTAQADEIVFMTGWLTERGEEVPSS